MAKKPICPECGYDGYGPEHFWEVRASLIYTPVDPYINEGEVWVKHHTSLRDGDLGYPSGDYLAAYYDSHDPEGILRFQCPRCKAAFHEFDVTEAVEPNEL